jgi:hypothetical protein
VPLSIQGVYKRKPIANPQRKPTSPKRAKPQNPKGTPKKAAHKTTQLNPQGKNPKPEIKTP